MAKGKAAGGKQQQKKTQKVVDDKTFGLKNKNKSKKVQQYVKNVEQQATSGGKKKKAFEEPKKSKKEIEAEKAAEYGKIFKPVVDNKKQEPGVDPKTILCQFFMQGTCKKGNKCRYSHDKTVLRKVNKIDMYTDVRKDEKEKDTMDKWSQDQLEDVVRQKQGKLNSNLQTNIVCKYFLEAIESQKYGWFWECPNGGEQCKYRHALPPGFVLKAPGEQQEDDEDEITLEEQLDEQRRLLKEKLAETGGGTAVTLERFLEWRAKHRAKKEEEIREKEEAAKKKDSKAERDLRKLLSGREMFVFKPDLFVDDDGAVDDEDYYRADSDDEEVHELEATGTSLKRTVVVAGKKVEEVGELTELEGKEEEEEEEEGEGEEKEKEKEEEEKAENGPTEPEKKDVPIDEKLFEDVGDFSDEDLE
eukprot:CAMPEP_0201477752 /NCGR_PEP_ID=MMETSP0151_2-20130828/2724_1 /ASSEMBLY_ACC=CAM_ASM_000257 /TAXON_ID=200890 /ORGANISM="Paramoeba atlantica, Strain 621/1 / CCAP 1560/9" /LENGTH=415 /DNA_ID=CAMNT_0047858581 /DNA_START=64 /DNA_END=1311 /DNA_ORIENTATION=-